MVQIARSWLDGSRAGTQVSCPPALLDDLNAEIRLCCSCGDPADGGHDHGWVPDALQEGYGQATAGRRGHLDATAAASGSCSAQFWAMLQGTVQGLVQGAPSALVQSAVRSLLEAGDVVSSKAALHHANAAFHNAYTAAAWAKNRPGTTRMGESRLSAPPGYEQGPLLWR